MPVGRNASIELRNMHATYAATWYVPWGLLRFSTDRPVTDVDARARCPTFAADNRFTLSAFTGFMFFRLMKRPTTVSSAQYRKLKDL